MLHGNVKRLDSSEQDSGRCEVTMETLYSFYQESDHRGFGICGVLKDPCGYWGMTCSTWCSAWYNKCSEIELSPSASYRGRNQSLEKAESVSLKGLRCRKRQPMIASPLLERDASSLKEVRRQGTWLVIQGNGRFNHFWRPVYYSSWGRNGLVDMGLWKIQTETKRLGIHS